MKKNTIVHDALVLAAFSCVLGLILGGVYMLTKPTIDEANLRKEVDSLKNLINQQNTLIQQLLEKLS